MENRLKVERDIDGFLACYKYNVLAPNGMTVKYFTEKDHEDAKKVAEDHALKLNALTVMAKEVDKAEEQGSSSVVFSTKSEDGDLETYEIKKILPEKLTFRDKLNGSEGNWKEITVKGVLNSILFIMDNSAHYTEDAIRSRVERSLDILKDES